MFRLAASPVQDVSFGTGLKITLDSYYDLLKTQLGTLQTEEFLQLKLVADTVDLSAVKKASDGGYVWFSYYNLLNRSDRAIQPIPVSGNIQIGMEGLEGAYGRFLRRLRGLVVIKELSAADQLALADIDKTLDSLKTQVNAFFKKDRVDWKDTAESMGFNIGDMNAYIQWSSVYGHIRDIQQLTEEIKVQSFKKNTILDRKYPNADDREVVDAEFDFDNPLMRLRYPIYPDSLYPNGNDFSPTYLALLPFGSTALFDDRLAAGWDKTLDTIRTTGAGSFTATMDRSTSSSSSISTDWSASGSGSYAFISVSASVSQHTAIQEDFSKGQSISVEAKSAFRVNIGFPKWFQPTLFKHPRVLENPQLFIEFFGPKGLLLYYPTALILVRGFSASFVSSQDWAYDYVSQFSASGGGGFNAFGVSFGSSASYSRNEHEHQVDKAKTTLTFSDDKDTLRFVGYAVKKNDVLAAPVTAGIASIGTQLTGNLSGFQ